MSQNGNQNHQQALILGCELGAEILFPQYFPLLAAIATKNLLAAAVATEDEEEKDDLRFSQA